MGQITGTSEGAINPQLLSSLHALATTYLSSRNGKLVEYIASGGSAAVFKADINGSSRALKVYDPKFFDEEGGPAELKRIELQRGLIGQECPSLVQTLAVNAVLGTCFIEMEFIGWPPLKAVLSQVDPSIVEELVGQLVEAAVFLEKHDLVHRDIKPENILVDLASKKLKVIDLGVVRKVDDEDDNSSLTDQGQRRPFIATAQYSSPEYLFRLEAPSAAMWHALTLYQIGGVIHDLVTKRPLFEAEVQTQNKFAVAFAVLRKVPDLSTAPFALRSIARVAANCLVKDPELRAALVSWDQFSHLNGSTEERLKELAKLSHARRDAARKQDDLIRERTRHQRSSVDAFSDRLKTSVVSATAGAYKVTSFTRDENYVQLTVSMSAKEVVAVGFDFDWDASQHTAAAVFVSANVGKTISKGGQKLPIAEFSLEHSDPAIFDEQALDALTKILAVAADGYSTGSDIEFADLVAVLRNETS